VKIRKLFRKEKVVTTLKGVEALRFRVSHSSLIHISLLVLILFIAFMVRLLPIRWGFHLSEFDPHFQYRLRIFLYCSQCVGFVSVADVYF